MIAPTPAEAARHLPPYLAEWNWMRTRRLDESRYDVVFTWELRTSLAAALLLPRRGRSVTWIALGPILKEAALRALPLVRPLLRKADHIVCFSRAECIEQARQLGLPENRFTFIPSPWPEEGVVGAQPNGDYVLALGRSNRDFATLFAAVRGTDLPVMVVAGKPADLRGAGLVPPNVTLRYSTESAETDALVAGARLQAIPLRRAPFSAGQSVLLRAMAAGKAVVATDVSGLHDYVVDGKTAVLVPPGDAAALRNSLLRLWEAEAERRRLGEAAVCALQNEFGYGAFAARLAALADAAHGTGC